MSEGTTEQRKIDRRTLGLFAAGMLLVLLLLAVAGNNGVIYAVCLLC